MKQKREVPDVGIALGYDPNFGGLDLSGCPSVAGLPLDSSWSDPDFAPIDVRGSGEGSRALKEFIAEQTADRQASTIHLDGFPFKVSHDGQLWRCDGEYRGERHRFTGASKDEIIAKLFALKKELVRELTADQRLTVARMCQSGDVEGGINAYLSFAADESTLERMTETERLPLLNEVAYFTWYCSTPTAPDTADWHAFRQQFIGTRPITHEILSASLAAFENRNRYPSLLAPSADETEEERIDPRQLEDLSDKQVNELYRETVRTRAANYRR